MDGYGEFYSGEGWFVGVMEGGMGKGLMVVGGLEVLFGGVVDGDY